LLFVSFPIATLLHNIRCMLKYYVARSTILCFVMRFYIFRGISIEFQAVQPLYITAEHDFELHVVHFLFLICGNTVRQIRGRPPTANEFMRDN